MIATNKTVFATCVNRKYNVKKTIGYYNSSTFNQM